MWLRVVMASRWFLLAFSLSLPFAGIGALVAGMVGALGGAVLGLVLLFVVSMIAEQVVFNVHGASPEAPSGVRRTYQRMRDADGSIHDRYPEIYVFPDPAPLALVARNPFSPGIILLSQGVLSTLGEQDLRELIEGCRLRSEKSWVPLATVCAVVAVAFVRFMPEAWLGFLSPVKASNANPVLVRDLRLGVSPALRFLVFYPFVSLCLKLGRGERATKADGLGYASHRGGQYWSRIRHPALFHLYLTA